MDSKAALFTSDHTAGSEIHSPLCSHMLMYHWKHALAFLEEAGFEKGGQKVYQLPEWPYLVITARKSV